MNARQTQISAASALSIQLGNIIPRDATGLPLAVYNSQNALRPGCAVAEDGTAEFWLYYPNASSVVLTDLQGRTFPLAKAQDYWTGRFALGNGFHGLFVTVDGNDTIAPSLPIAFSGNRPLNFVQICGADSVIAPMAVPHGSVVMEYLESQITGRFERIYVYLPPCYEGGTRRYPVVYLQHGHGENETCWVNQGKMNFICDNLIAENQAEPAIVVMCNGMLTRQQGDDICLDFTEGFEAFLVQEVIPYIDGKYRTFADREHRAMAGLSMGSIQTSIVTAKHPELFAWVGLFSGFFQDPLTGYDAHIQPERLAAYREGLRLLFRGIGDGDSFLPCFLSDDALLERHGIPNLRRMYEGVHEWKVWQQCFHDFMQCIFK